MDDIERACKLDECVGICIQWTGLLDWSAGMEYWNGVTGMEQNTGVGL